MSGRKQKFNRLKKWERQERTDSPAEREKINYLPFVADLRVPEIAVPAKPTSTKFKFGEDQHFLHDRSSYRLQVKFWHKRPHLHARQDRGIAKY